MIFDTILNLLKREIPPIEFERYIKPLEFDEEASKSDVAIIKAINPFIAKWVDAHYSEKLSELFEKETGIKPQIRVVVGKVSPSISSTNSIASIAQINIKAKSTPLNPSLTFESFVKGPSNEFAYTCALNVAKKPAKTYNPFFIYGGTGLGKTHLLQAIGHKMSNDGKSVIYATIEQFTNEFIGHLRTQTMDRFRDKYRKCDALLIDDVQFLSNKEQTQEEFFHTFNELYQDGCQIVMTSDKHPKQIIGIEERLKSRFESGLIADVAPPQLETKIMIIEKKCELNGIKFSSEVIMHIASALGENVREIEGIITKINAYARMTGQEVSLDFAKGVLKDSLRETKANITIERIIEVVSHELNVKSDDIRSKSKMSTIVNARRIVIYLARDLTPNSMPIIANFFGMKDHSAISHSIKKLQESLQKDATFNAKIEELKNKIKQA